MNCNNEQIAALLSDYFSGHLASDEVESVREHITTCPVCRESLRTMTLISSPGETGLKSHPSKDVLGLYYQDRSRLAPMIADLVQVHLSKCRDCAAELAVLDDLERGLRESISDTSSSDRRITQVISRYGRYVAYAAAACLLLSVGYRVMRTEVQDGSAIVTYRLAESQRSESGLPEIKRTATTETLVFEVPFYHARTENDYTVYFTDAQGKTIIAKLSHVDFPKPGLLLVRLPSSDLRDGEYRLVVREAKHGGVGEPALAYFPFRLSSGS